MNYKQYHEMQCFQGFCVLRKCSNYRKLSLNGVHYSKDGVRNGVHFIVKWGTIYINFSPV